MRSEELNKIPGIDPAKIDDRKDSSKDDIEV